VCVCVCARARVRACQADAQGGICEDEDEDERSHAEVRHECARDWCAHAATQVQACEGGAGGREGGRQEMRGTYPTIFRSSLTQFFTLLKLSSSVVSYTGLFSHIRMSAAVSCTAPMPCP